MKDAELAVDVLTPRVTVTGLPSWLHEAEVHGSDVLGASVEGRPSRWGGPALPLPVTTTLSLLVPSSVAVWLAGVLTVLEEACETSTVPVEQISVWPRVPGDVLEAARRRHPLDAELPVVAVVWCGRLADVDRLRSRRRAVGNLMLAFSCGGFRIAW